MDTNLLTVAWAQLWQVTLLVVVVAVLTRTVGRNRPHLAYALWLVVLVKCVMPPIWSSPSGVFCWIQPLEHITIVKTPVLSAPVMLAATPDELVIPLYPVERVQTVSTESPTTIEAPKFRFSPTDLATCGLVVWAIGATVSLALSTWRWQACLRTARRAGDERDTQLAVHVHELAQRLGLRRSVRVIVTQGQLGPAVTGILRPTLLMPEGMLTSKTPAELEPILVHELVHIRRGDLWAGLLQTIVLAVWWFHPLVRWAVRQAMREAERCCDEAVLAELGCKPKEYARSLLGVLQYKMEWAPAPAFPGAGRIGGTAKRLERIMGLGQGCRRRSPWWCWLVMLGVAAVVLPGGAFVVSGEKEEGATAESVAPIPRMASPGEETVVPPGRTEKGHPLPGDLPRAAAPVQEYVVPAKRTGMPAPAPRPRAAVPTPYRGPNVTKSYPMGKILAKCRESRKEDPEAIREAIVERLGLNQPDVGPLKVIWTDEGMTVSAPTVVHEQIIEGKLALLEKHGLSQVVIEVVCIEGKSSAIGAILGQLDTTAMAVLESDSPETWRSAIVEDELQDVVRRVQKQEGTRVLASPRLITQNGRVASFQTGSEVPWSVEDSEGKAEVRFVNVGVEMRFVPHLLENGVRLDYDAEASRLEPSSAAQYKGKVHHRKFGVSCGVEVALGKVVAIQAPTWQGESPMKTLFLVRVDKSASIPVAGQPATSETGKERSDIYVRTYVVPDLVLPLPSPVIGVSLGVRASSEPSTSQKRLLPPPCPVRQDALASDFGALDKLITKTIQPATWEDAGGRGSIAFHEENLSLVIWQTEAVHDEIADLLKQLRRMQNAQVVLRTRAVEMSEESCPEFLAPLSEETTSMVLDGASAKRLLAEAGDGVQEAPAVRLMNGQHVRISLDDPSGGSGVEEGLAVQAVISNDHREIRLTAQTTRTPLHHANLSLASGDSAVFEFTGSVDRAEPGRRSFLLVTALVVEEEARVGAVERRDEVK